MDIEPASIRRRDTFGRRVLGFIKGSPKASVFASSYDLDAQFDPCPAVDQGARPAVVSRTTAKVVFKDFDEFAEAINGIAGRFVPTARSEADWWVQVVPIGRVAIQQIQIGGASVFAGEGADDALSIGIPVAHARRIRIDGQPLDDSSFILVKEGRPFTLATKQATLWAGITVPVDHPSLSRDLLSLLDCRFTDATSTARRRAPLDHVMRARNLVSRLCTDDGSVAFLDEAAARAAEEEIMIVTNHVLEASSRASSKHTGRPKFSRDRVIARALAFIEGRSGEPLLIQDLCGATQVSERTLRTIFQEHFGVSPMRLLKARQLREIRYALMLPEASGHTVAQIAARYGVWDYSLFARNYRALYGETPMETLRTAARIRARAQQAVADRRESIFADQEETAALASIDRRFDALILQQKKLSQEMQKYATDLHAFAAWARDFSRSQFGGTRGNA